MRLDFLHHLTEHQGPFTSVCLDATRTGPVAGREVGLRWEAQARRLRDLGATPALLDAVGDLIVAPTGHAGAVARLVVADRDQVVLDLVLPAAPAREESALASVPHLMPAVRGLDGCVPYVLVSVDRTGADIDVVDHLGDTARHEQVEGGHDVLHKVPGGGMSQRRYQARVEDSWERNADQVGAELARVLRRHGAEVVFVSGDDKAVAALLEATGREVHDRLVRLRSGGRAAGTSEDARGAQVRAALDAHQARHRGDLLERFAGAESHQQGAVRGLADVVDALRRSQVDEIVLQDDPSSTRTLWVGAAALEIGQSRDDLASMGVTAPTRVRADAALVWAALASHAAITLVRPDEVRLTDGIGALLRWSDASTPHDMARSMPGHGEPRG